MFILPKNELINQAKRHNEITKGTLPYNNVSIRMKAQNMEIDYTKVKKQLKMHQKLTLMYMIHLEKTKRIFTDENLLTHAESNFGYISDPVGSGKSLIVLAAIALTPKLTYEREHKQLASNQIVYYDNNLHPNGYFVSNM